MTDSTERFAGFAELYDRARPKPPADIVELVRQWVGVEDPDVVDLGAGTGGATLLWDRAIAVEPSADMRELAHQRLDPARFQVVDGTAEATGLPDDCADVVTASQALHWFDPATAFPEIARILRPGGVFVAFDCDWPPAVDWEVDAAWAAFEEHLRGVEHELDLQPPTVKSEHVERLRASGLFEHVTEICLHGKESGDARRLYELALSQSGSMELRKAGYSDEQIGLAALHEVANRRLPVVKTWWWTYRVRLAVTPTR